MDGIWTLHSRAVLPLVYEEALSYGEQVALFRHKLNEVIDATNSFQASIDTITADNAAIKKLLDTLVDDFDNYAAELNSLENLLDQYYKAYSDFEVKVLNEFTNINSDITDNTNKLNQLKNEISLKFAELYGENAAFTQSIKQNFDALKQELTNFITNQTAENTGNTLLVNDPIYDKTTTLNKSLQNLLNVMIRFSALTVQEYDEMKIPVEEYDNMEIPVVDYDTRAAFIFFPRRLRKIYEEEFKNYQKGVEKIITTLDEELAENTYLDNPYTGQSQQPISSVTEYILKNILPSIPVELYDSWNINVEDYDKKEISVLDYGTKFLPKYLWEAMQLTGFPEDYTYKFSCGPGELKYYVKSAKIQTEEQMLIEYPDFGYECVMVNILPNGNVYEINISQNLITIDLKTDPPLEDKYFYMEIIFVKDN